MAIIDNDTQTLEQALKNSLPQAERVDILTAYFYFSGFSTLIDELKDKKIRILVGKAIDPGRINELIMAQKANPNVDLANVTSPLFANKTRSQRKTEYIDSFIKLFNSEALGEAFDSTKDQESFKIFEEKLKDGSLEIKMTNTDQHGKYYVLTNKPEFSQNGDYKGNVYHGSNNFTYNGLRGQGEIATVMRDNRDYDEFEANFEKLWQDGNAVSIQTVDSNSDFLEEIQKRLWIHATPDPYKVFIRILCELYTDVDDESVKPPSDISGGHFANFTYQLDAIKQGLECIEKNNGVIVADVVGLGKSIIASALAYNLDMPRTIIITPPHLKQQWMDYVAEFQLRGAIVESGGKIEELHARYANSDRETLFIIDEAHRYRNEDTDTYTYLHQLTRSNPNNKVILLSATPYNNHPRDVYAMIKLFQTPSRSTINVVDNLGLRFSLLIAQYNKLEKEGKHQMTAEIKSKLEELAKAMRTMIEPVVIRRSRIDLKEINAYAEDLKRQNISFPKVNDPELISYELGGLSELYRDTLEKIGTDTFTGAKYRPLTYLKDPEAFSTKYQNIFEFNLTQQMNMAKLARRLFVLRFESSKYAFQSTLDNMSKSLETTIRWWTEHGVVPISDQLNKLDPDKVDDIEDIEDLMADLDSGELLDDVRNKGLAIPKDMFKSEFINDVQTDLLLLQDIKKMWLESEDAEYDPKQDKVEEQVSEMLKDQPDRKIVIFTSFADTAMYVADQFAKHGLTRTLLYTGSSNKSLKTTVSENFDASYPIDKQKNDYDIIVATDALSEGFNLHRAGVIINYDIPYNPTRVIQRVGRINRINKKMFDELFIYNFFPTVIGEDVVNIKGISSLKMLLINSVVGSDTKTLTADEDLKSYFTRQYREADKDSEDRSWDNEYRNIYDSIKHDKTLLEEVSRIPERTRIVRTNQAVDGLGVSFAKRGNGSLFAIAEPGSEQASIASPEEALQYFKADIDEKSQEGDSELDGRFEILRSEIMKPFELPKMTGNRGKALDVIEALRDTYPPEADYLSDLYDTIKNYDDLSDGELQIITKLKLTDIEKAVEALKERLPAYYLNNIREKVEQVEHASETIMFTEDLRK